MRLKSLSFSAGSCIGGGLPLTASSLDMFSPEKGKSMRPGGNLPNNGMNEVGLGVDESGEVFGLFAELGPEASL